MALSEAAIPCLPMNFPAWRACGATARRLFLARALDDADNPPDHQYREPMPEDLVSQRYA